MQNDSVVAFGEMWPLYVAAHQTVGLQVAEAQALTISSSTAALNAAPFSKTSTRTGPADMDNAGVHSVAAINSSSEISGEHMVIHLRAEKSWEKEEDGPETSQPIQEEEPSSLKSNNTSDITDVRNVENHGGSTHEEQDGGYLESPDTTKPFSIGSSTPQPQTSGVLTEFVNTLMRPFRYWTGGENVAGSEKEASVLEEKAGENRAQGEASDRSPSMSKPNGSKDNMDNAIIEHRSDGVSFRATTSGLQRREEGLSEQEKEVMPLIQLMPAVPSTGQNYTKEDHRDQASRPPSVVKGMNSCLCIFWSLQFIFNISIPKLRVRLKQKWGLNSTQTISNSGLVHINVTGKYVICFCNAFCLSIPPLVFPLVCNNIFLL